MYQLASVVRRQPHYFCRMDNKLWIKGDRSPTLSCVTWLRSIIFRFKIFVFVSRHYGIETCTCIPGRGNFPATCTFHALPRQYSMTKCPYEKPLLVIQCPRPLLGDADQRRRSSCRRRQWLPKPLIPRTRIAQKTAEYASAQYCIVYHTKSSTKNEDLLIQNCAKSTGVK